MSIKQFNAGYSSNDDRIIFRFNTIDHSEYVFWLTRKVTHIILRSSGQFIKSEYEKLTPSVENVISEIQQADKQNTSFAKPFESGVKYPLGGEPVLVLDAKCQMLKINEQDLFSIDLLLPGGGNLNLKLTLPILKSLVLLLEDVNIQAKWGAI